MWLRIKSKCGNRKRRSYLSENKKCKNDNCIIVNLPSNGVIAKIVLRDLDLLFEGQIFEMLKYLKRLALVQKCMERLLNIVKFTIKWSQCQNLFRDHDLLFIGKKCETISLKWTNMLGTTTVDILSSKDNIAKIVLHDLDPHFEDTKFET